MFGGCTSQRLWCVLGIVCFCTPGKDSSPDPEAGLIGVLRWALQDLEWRGFPLRATMSLTAFSSVPAGSLHGPGYKETVEKTPHSLLINEHL